MTSNKRYKVHDQDTDTYEYFDTLEEVKEFLDEVPWAITVDTKENKTILPWEIF